MCSLTRKLGLFLILLFAAVVVLAPAAYAQNRGFQGKVTDDKGEPVANAKIHISGVSSRRTYDTKTDKNGGWVYMNLPLGVYYIVVRAPGFNPNYQQKEAAVGFTTVDFKMEPGDPNLKLPFELSPEELEKLKQEQGKAEKQAKMMGEIKQFFDAGRALLDQNDYPGAIEQFKKALEKAPEQPTVLANLADAYFKNNQDQDAMDTYLKAISLNPDDPGSAPLYQNLGVVYGKMGKTAESQQAFQKAATLNPGAAAQNFYNLGATLVNAGQTKQAADAFRQAIKSDPNYAEAHYQLGLCLLGDPATMSDAVQELEAYVKIGKDPKNVEAAKGIIEAVKK